MDVTSKICSMCGRITPAHIDYFQNRKDSKDGLRANCMKCTQSINKVKYINNRNQILERVKKYNLKNKEKVEIYQIKYREKNKENLKKHYKNYQKENKIRIAEYKSDYYQKNKTRINNYCKKYWNISENKIRKSKQKRSRYRNDSLYRLNYMMSNTIRLSLKNGSKNGQHWETLVDFTIEELSSKLKHSIPKGYTWDDFMSGNLELDHINPISKHSYTKPNDGDFKNCWSLSNFQLLPAMENKIKSNKLKKPLQMGLVFG